MARVSKREIMTVTEVLSRLGCVQKRTKHERYWIVAEYLTKATPSAAEIARRGATSLAKKLGSN